MVFSSSTFAVFFMTVYLLYILSARRLAVQNLLLLVCSYVFYGWWDWRFLSLIWVSTAVDFVCGWQLDRRNDSNGISDGKETAQEYLYSPAARKAVLAVSVCANLGILGFFKYFDFFATGCSELLTQIGLPLDPRLLNVVLPLGISFYTFQTLSYTIDVYRGQLRAHRSLLEFATFVAFFPQLVAGPILRAKDFLPQVARPRTFNIDRFYEGGYLIFWGLFKKVVIADNLAHLVDPVFDLAPTAYNGGEILVAVYAFSIQIYCDFSGYTDIARGCAKMMGFEFPLNFNLPYFSSNPVEFWRRWHISLSSWLRDYLYMPLGGNRKGKRRTHINLMLTMVLGGLWHGAGLGFVLWGAYQGILLVVYKVSQPVITRVVEGRSEPFRQIAKLVAIAVFFHFVCLGWLIFRSESIERTALMLQAILTPWPWWIICGAKTMASTGVATLAVYAGPLLALQLGQWIKNDLNIVMHMPAPARGLVYTAMFYGLVCHRVNDGQPFIYFQF